MKLYLKKLCRGSIEIIKQGEVPGGKCTDKGENDEVDDETDIGYNQADHGNNSYHDDQHQQGNDIGHPANPPDMRKDFAEVEGFGKTAGPCKPYIGGCADQSHDYCDDDDD